MLGFKRRTATMASLPWAKVLVSNWDASSPTATRSRYTGMAAAAVQDRFNVDPEDIAVLFGPEAASPEAKARGPVIIEVTLYEYSKNIGDDLIKEARKLCDVLSDLCKGRQTLVHLTSVWHKASATSDTASLWSLKEAERNLLASMKRRREEAAAKEGAKPAAADTPAKPNLKLVN